MSAVGSPDAIRVLLPDASWIDRLGFADRELERPSQGRPIELAVHAGDGPVDDDLLGWVNFYVPQYMGPPSGLALMSRMPRLRVVQALTTGVDDVLAYLPPAVTLCSAAGVHAESTAELAVGLAIASLRGIDDAARDMTSGQWRHAKHRTLIGARALVVGAGALGQGISRRLIAMGAQVALVSRTPRDAGGDGLPSVLGLDSLDSALAHAELVFLAVPLTAETTGLVDARRLALLTDAALVVNVARGAVLDQDAARAEVGRLRFALDVTVPEPLPADDPLWRAEGVLISPHIGGDTWTSSRNALELVRGQLLRASRGEPLVNVVTDGRPAG